MIRFVVALSVFAVVLCGWIVLRDDSTPVNEGVTRTQGADLSAPVAALPTPAPTEPRGPSALRQRLAAEGRTTLVPLPGRATPAAPVADIESAVQAALAPLRSPVEPAAEVALAQAGADADLSKSVIGGILRARGIAANEPAKAPASLEDIVTQALQQGQSDAYVNALLEAAHENDLVESSAALQTADGKLDTRTLLTQIVTKAAPTVAPVPELVGGPGVEVRTIQRAGGTETYRFYTVQSGDSLGYIAQKFYGDAGKFPLIWQANRQILSSPDKIRKDQRLVIPDPA